MFVLMVEDDWVQICVILEQTKPSVSRSIPVFPPRQCLSMFALCCETFSSHHSIECYSSPDSGGGGDEDDSVGSVCV